MTKCSKLMFALTIGFFMLLQGQLQQAQAQAFYYIRNAQTGWTMDVPLSALTSPGAAIGQYPWNGGVNQQFQIMGHCSLLGTGSPAPVDCDGYVWFSARNSYM